MSARQELRAVGVRTQPLAFGLTKWGPMPGTADQWIMWDGPESGLTLYARDPDKPGALGHQIRHPSANKAYATVADAEAAVAAFVALVLRDGADL